MDQPGPQIWRFGMTLAVFLGLFALVGVRLQHLQLAQGSHLAEMGSKQRERTWYLPAPRGNIVDASGAPLAESSASWTLYADPLYMVDRLRATVELARILGVDRARLREQFESQRNGRVLARGLDDKRADAIKALGIEGVYVSRDFTRIYREGGLAAHALGFVDGDGHGGGGVELLMDKLLSGTPGKESVSIDAHGQPLANDSVHIQPKAGAQVQLTIDLVLQRIVEKELIAEVEASHPANAAALLIDPMRGDILALASWPSYQPADHQGLDAASMRDNAIGFVYEPGSVMKPLVAGAAVSDHLAQWNERIFCEHGKWTYRFGNAERTITDHSLASGGHGMLTVTQGIALSDNILMAKLGLRIGPERLWQWETAFGFGRRTGIALPGEDAGIMLPKARWTVLGSTMSVPMGHEIAVTPLQMAMAHAAIAHGGVWQPPRIIARITSTDDNGQTIDLPIPALPPSRRIYDSEEAAEIQDAMTHTMTEGTGKDVQLDGYTAAGKTGTAEKLVDGHYSHDHHVGSFVCWAPATRGVSPALLCLVVIDDPSVGGHYGAQNAAPTVQKILQQALEERGVPRQTPPEEPHELPPVGPPPAQPAHPAAPERPTQVAQADSGRASPAALARVHGGRPARATIMQGAFAR
jgi:cell division protein FtsI/penicillin-binding protein 2